MPSSIIKKMSNLLLLNSILFSLFSKSMFFIWASMEFNMIFYILMMKKINPNSMNSMMKYFIVQSMASSLLIMSLLFMNKTQNMTMPLTLITISMWIKMGMFPFSAWYFQISENMDWNSWITLNTLQKLPPLLMITYCPSFKLTILTMIIMNSIYSMVEIWNQTSLRWMINSSSINHLSWMIMSTTTLYNPWETYFMVYTIISATIGMMMKQTNWSSLSTTFSTMPIFKSIIFLFIMLNMIGVPPFLGFLPKLMILMSQQVNTTTLMLMISSMMTATAYFNYNTSNIKVCMTNKLSSNSKTLSLMSISTLTFILLIMNIM